MLPLLASEGVSSFPDAESGCAADLVGNPTPGPLHPPAGWRCRNHESKLNTHFVDFCQAVQAGKSKVQSRVGHIDPKTIAHNLLKLDTFNASLHTHTDTQEVPHLMVLSLHQAREAAGGEKSRQTVILSYFTLFQPCGWTDVRPLATGLQSYSSVANRSSFALCSTDGISPSVRTDISECSLQVETNKSQVRMPQLKVRQRLVYNGYILGFSIKTILVITGLKLPFYLREGHVGLLSTSHYSRDFKQDMWLISWGLIDWTRSDQSLSLFFFLFLCWALILRHFVSFDLTPEMNCLQRVRLIKLKHLA